MSAAKKEVRQYSEDYLQFGFIPSSHDLRIPMCLICQQCLSNEGMKFGRLKKHFESKHPLLIGKPLSYFSSLKEKFTNRSTITKCFVSQTAKQSPGLIASYKIAELIAKTGNSHTIGENLIKPALSIFCKDVLSQLDEVRSVFPSAFSVNIFCRICVFCHK